MRSAWKYLLAAGLLVITLVFVLVLPYFGGKGWAGACYPGGWMTGSGMMRGWNGYSGFSWFGGTIMMFGMLLIPLLLVGLGVAGIVALARGSSSSSAMQASVKPCPQCGKYIQDGWRACPYCGEKV